MKIGILTFHRAHNYGAFLQCYALQEAIKSLGHEVFVIDYIPKWMSTRYKWFNIKYFIRLNILGSIKSIFDLPNRKRRYNSFNNTQEKNLNLFKTPNFEAINSFFDCVIIGSDQVWNKTYTGCYNSYYFGQFKIGSRPKLIAYAPSMESIEMSEIEQKEMSSLLNKFDFISVREENMLNALQPLTSNHISSVLDPTFLNSKKFWEDYAEINKSSQPYIFLYQASFKRNVIDYAIKIAKEKNLKLITLSSGYSKGNVNNIWDASPKTFISLIKNSEFVLTTSFHGTALSIILNKTFVTLSVSEVANSRASNILDLLGLQQCKKTLQQEFNIPNINWMNINDKIEQLSEKSLNFLRNSLEV